MKRYKLSTAFAFVMLSGAMFYSHVTGRLFPGLPIGTLVAVGALVATGLSVYRPAASDLYPSPPSLVWYLLPLIVVGVVYRSFIFFFPASFVGVDPPGYAEQITRVTRTGDIGTINVFFYSDAPLSISFPAMLSITTGGNSQLAMGLYPLMIGLLSPVIVAALTVRVADSDPYLKTVLAAGLATVATASVTFSFWPIAQSLGLAYWMVLLLSLTLFVEGGSKRILMLLVLVLCAQVYTHKLPLLVIFAVLLTIVVVSRVVDTVGFRERQYPISSNMMLLLGITAALLVIQWTLLTNQVQSVIIQLRELLSTTSVEVSPPLVSEPPTAAEQPSSGIDGILSRHGHWLSLLLFGGVAWPIVAYRRFGSRAIRFLLVSVAVPVFFLAVSIAGVDGPPPLRLISFIEPALIPMAAVALGGGLVRLQRCRFPVPWPSLIISVPSFRTALTVGMFVFLIGVQIFSPVAIPDFPGSDRTYTTTQEVNAKSFGYEHVDGQIHSDWFLGISEAPRCTTATSDHTCISNEIRDGSTAQYEDIGLPLLNANVTTQGYDHVMYRTNVTYYRTSMGEWRLLWDPEQHLDGTYNRVYANGGAILYDRVSGNETMTTPGNQTAKEAA